MIEGLSERGKKLYHFILKGIQQGLPGAEILRQLRELGQGYRIKDFYNDLRIIKGETLKWDTMKFVRRDRVISPDLYTPSPAASANFITRFEIVLRDPVTGYKKTVYVSIGHEAPMRRIDLETIVLEDYIKRGMQLYDEAMYRIESIKPMGGFRRVRGV